ncbi:C-4 sterol methyl oxidase [Irineochytrium annulatum]|nr:C-4 sterol methyl oxidase [Irineochytrium annulatum]
MEATNGTLPITSDYQPNAVEAAWVRLFENSSNPALTLATVMFIWHEIVYFGRFLPYLILDYIPFFQQYKIQTVPLTREQVYKVIVFVIKSQFGVQLPMLMGFYGAARFLGMRLTEVPFPTLTTIALQVAFFVFCEDAYHYFTHRAMHWGPLYKHIHKLHHEYQAPFGITAEYAHFMEVLILGIGFFVGPAIVAVATMNTPDALHVVTLAAWLAVRLITTVDDHSGYDFPWSLHHWIPFWAGADFHDYHHMAFVGNYSSTFRHWDWLFGTDKGYKEHSARLRAARKAKKAVALAQTGKTVKSGKAE